MIHRTSGPRMDPYQDIRNLVFFANSDSRESQIQKFFSDKSIFITGATGFMGKILVEKLLRTCSELKMIYLLMRKRSNGISIQKRVDLYFEDIIFDKMKEDHPDFRSKVFVIEGDITLPGLGIAEEFQSLLIEEVDIVIHNAANVYFEAKPSDSLTCNVLGTKEVLELANQCKHIQCFMYVSTAYSHCYRTNIYEKLYDPPGDLKMVQDIIAADRSTQGGISQESLKMLLGDWPNIYTFSKALAEGIVDQYAKKLKCACVIFRPSIVVPTIREPLKGWCDNKNGMVKMAIGVGLGFVRVAYKVPCSLIDIVPVDTCINAMLAVIWDSSMKEQNIDNNLSAMIYNYASSGVKQINIHRLYKVGLREGSFEPALSSVWLNKCLVVSNWYLFLFFHFLLHCVPAFFIDLALIATFHKPKALPIVYKLSRYLDKIHYFAEGNWRIYMDETLKMMKKMNPADQELFFCDVRRIDWQECSVYIWRGIKKYILNEPLDSKLVRRKELQLKILHYSSLLILSLLTVYLLWYLKFFEYYFNHIPDYCP